MPKRRTIASIDTAIADIQKRLVSLEKRKTKLSDKLNELKKSAIYVKLKRSSWPFEKAEKATDS